jgi:hypothetical protein
MKYMMPRAVRLAILMVALLTAGSAVLYGYMMERNSYAGDWETRPVSSQTVDESLTLNEPDTVDPDRTGELESETDTPAETSAENET